jgi:acylphosphatase
MSEIVRAHLVIRGYVQGVFFRDSTRREATARRLVGWVRNRRDGAVEAVFQGERAAVEALVGWCHHGPPHAAVEAVDVTWEEPRPGEASFHVR